MQVVVGSNLVYTGELWMPCKSEVVSILELTKKLSISPAGAWPELRDLEQIS